MRTLSAIAFAAFVALGSCAGLAQEFPNKPIKFIVPFPPGGPADTIARLAAEKMAEILKQPVVLDNRGGAGGATGTAAVAKSAPDGYTIGISTAGALAISPSLQEALSYDPQKDLYPLTLAARVPELLVVAKDIPANSMAELVALAKAKPGTMNFASSGPGSMPHLAGELFKRAAGIDIVHVPYRGAAPAVNDLVGGHVQMMFMDIAVLLPHVQSGAAKAIAIGSKQRVLALPNLPTTAELGMPKVEADNWYGIIAPVGMPADVTAKLHAAVVAALKSDDVTKKLADQGAIVVANASEDFRAYLKSEIEKWADVVKAASVTGK